MTGKRDICLYDGHCGMCRRTARTLRFLDWFGLLAFADLAEASRTNPMIDPAAALRGMPIRWPTCGGTGKVIAAAAEAVSRWKSMTTSPPGASIHQVLNPTPYFGFTAGRENLSQ